MKRLLQTVAIMIICGAMTVPAVEARENNRRGGNVSQEQSSRGNRDSDRNKNNGNNNRRRQPQNQNNGNKGNGHNAGNPRPGNNDNRNVRPDNNSRRRPLNNTYRPERRPDNHRPATPPRHDNYRPSARHAHHAPVYGVPPHRPHRPAPRHFGRPVPPPAFRPHYHVTPLRAILGISFGTALNVSLNTLSCNNYCIDGYADNRVYLRNVRALDLMWPDATLFYTDGYLASSSFSYSTPYYDNARYNSVYNNLVGLYGMPVATRNINNGWSATWWGYDNRYITLEFQPLYSAAGGLRYYTTLIMGN